MTTDFGGNDVAAAWHSSPTAKSFWRAPALPERQFGSFALARYTVDSWAFSASTRVRQRRSR